MSISDHVVVMSGPLISSDINLLTTVLTKSASPQKMVDLIYINAIEPRQENNRIHLALKVNPILFSVIFGILVWAPEGNIGCNRP